MKINRVAFAVLGVSMFVPVFAISQDGSAVAKSVRGHFNYINGKILTMAKDFPEDKYDFKLRPEMRSFHDLIVHIAGGNIYAVKAGRGEKTEWTEADPKLYKTKGDVVAMFEKSMNDAGAVLETLPDSSFDKTIEPWSEVTEHSAEHYGLLVAYYRANGLVPPDSRPK